MTRVTAHMLEHRVADRRASRMAISASRGRGGRPVSPTATDISRLWTTPRARGHGVGATLVAAAVDGAVPPVRLSVWDWREPATRLYRRFGFEPVPSWDDRARLVCLERR
ncbi:GNAT family N-acetyltransferase [Microbacterium trichothecenolyticum]|uniref:GNAT family N-acetyltransferase n=1 Tax=Microbacterium trichothecenolyticum TaxID=69370 RepID=UPI0027D87153|nr:GNAT family N-acetyltransferase [Microbacterium trichothecenolyticum]